MAFKRRTKIKRIPRKTSSMHRRISKLKKRPKGIRSFNILFQLDRFLMN